MGKQLENEMENPFDKSKCHPNALTTKKYGVNKELLRACASREFLLMKRFPLSTYSKPHKGLTYLAILTTTLFLRTKMNLYTKADAESYVGALFFTVTVAMFNGISELNMAIMKLYMASALFRLMAEVGRDIVVANTAGTFALLTITAVHKWFLYGYWSSPMMYGQNAIAVNEFLGRSWRKVSPNSNETLGVLILKSRGFFPQAYCYWIGIGALISNVFLFNFLFTLALQYLSPFRKDQAGLSQEKLFERKASMGEELFQLPTTKRSSGEWKKKQPHPFLEKLVKTTKQVIGKEKHGSSLSTSILTFDEIRYSVDMQQVLVVLVFRPGVLTVLMGVSGAGKTTLMDVLSGWKTSGYIEGSITIS
ncbi:unnamed protein product [Sphenostylis stenocarpa]|uniref:ABC transporter domain-containing protein n=1 Tax=Sphenostylis stenocarpa TaxID=92480 RepID=A0AA86T0M4_9FABA|nr:unnamed protein product [Sphenostylis stenocarpa]